MSNSHTVVTGDTLGKIAVTYLHAWNKWPEIVAANPQLNSRKTASDGSPLIYAGDVLVIPESSYKTQARSVVSGAVGNKKAVVLDKNAGTEFSLFLNNQLFTGFSAFKIVLNDDALDAFSLSAPYDSQNELFRLAFKPFQYIDCALYFNRKIVFAGKLLTPEPVVDSTGESINLQGYPLCGVLFDCSLPDSKFPPAYTGLTLREIAEDAASAFGISVVFNGNSGSVFDEVAYDIGEKIGGFLAKLCAQRSLVMTNNDEGNLLFWNAKESKACAIFKENGARFISCATKYDSQNFFSHITGYTKVSEEDEEKADCFTFENTLLTKKGILRPYSFTLEDTEKTDLQTAVQAKAASMFATCVSWTLTVSGCTDDSGNIFKKGCCISVMSETAQILKETKMQAKTVTISKDDTNGVQTVFELILPGLRSGKIPEKFPWEE